MGVQVVTRERDTLLGARKGQAPATLWDDSPRRAFETRLSLPDANATAVIKRVITFIQRAAWPVLSYAQRLPSQASHCFHPDTYRRRSP